jgi:diguanylate cyclase (GGDEF)-like protein
VNQPRIELVPLSDRLAALQAVRLALALVAVAAAGGHAAALLPGALVYVAVTGAVEMSRRRARTRALEVVKALVLFDGLFLAFVLLRTGGPQSPLLFLVYLHVVAVTLLVSHRTGLKVALWHALLLFGVYALYASGIAALPGWVNGSAASRHALQRAALFGSVGFWVIALSTAAFSALSERELRRRRDEMSGLAAMAARLERARRPEEVLEVALAELAQSLHAERGVAVALPRADQGKATTMLFDRQTVMPVVSGLDGGGAISRACYARAPQLVHQLDAVDDPHLDALLPDATNLVLVPLMVDGEAVGAIVIEHGGDSATRVSARSINLATQFASHAALALANAWLLAEVERLATTDALTGVANRRVLQDQLSREIRRQTRTHEPLSVVMLDVDHFKAVNDTHGHQTGDDVLKAVAAALAEASRDTDLVARYGGEEFCVVMPDCGWKEAVAVAERLRRAVNAAPSPVAVTVSAGVATSPANGDDAETLISAADGALYDAKAAGRNRTVRSRRRRRRSLIA